MIPYALKSRLKEGILESVKFADWAAPIVPVLKSDKKFIRICGDFKQTVNNASKLDQSLAGGKSFTKLDMSQALIGGYFSIIDSLLVFPWLQVYFRGL